MNRNAALIYNKYNLHVTQHATFKLTINFHREIGHHYENKINLLTHY